MDKEFVEAVKQGEIKGYMNSVVKANALKRRIEECAAESKKIEEALKVLEQKRRNSKMNGMLLQCIPLKLIYSKFKMSADS